MLNHITFTGFDTDNPAEEFLQDVTTCKWTLISFSENFALRLDSKGALNINSYVNVDAENPRTLYFTLKNGDILNHTQLTLKLEKVKEIEKSDNYYLRFNNGECVSLSKNELLQQTEPQPLFCYWLKRRSEQSQHRKADGIKTAILRG